MCARGNVLGVNEPQRDGNAKRDIQRNDVGEGEETGRKNKALYKRYPIAGRREVTDGDVFERKW